MIVIEYMVNIFKGMDKFTREADMSDLFMPYLSRPVYSKRKEFVPEEQIFSFGKGFQNWHSTYIYRKAKRKAQKMCHSVKVAENLLSVSFPSVSLSFSRNWLMRSFWLMMPLWTHKIWPRTSWCQETTMLTQALKNSGYTFLFFLHTLSLFSLLYGPWS